MPQKQLFNIDIILNSLGIHKENKMEKNICIESPELKSTPTRIFCIIAIHYYTIWKYNILPNNYLSFGKKYSVISKSKYYV
jgi:hypothetical protein